MKHWILDMFPTKKKRVEDIITKGTKSMLTSGDEELLNEVLEMYELALVDLWDKKDSNEFIEISGKCFDILKALPLPLPLHDDMSEIRLIRRALKILAYSHLSNRHAEGREFLSNQDLWNVDVNEETWDKRLLKKIYLAILHLVRGEPNCAIDIINDLRIEQRKYESRYLNAVEPENKRSAALELASLYFLARGVEVLGESMLSRIDTSSTSSVNYLLDKSMKFSEWSGNLELFDTLRLVQAMFDKLILSIDKTVKYDYLYK